MSQFTSQFWLNTKLSIEINRCENRKKCQIAETVHDMKCWNAENFGNRVLGLALCHVRKTAGTSGWSVPISQSQTTVFVGQWMEWDSLPPCLNWCIEMTKIAEEKLRNSKVRSFTSIQMVHTHTHKPLHTYLYTHAFTFRLFHTGCCTHAVYICFYTGTLTHTEHWYACACTQALLHTHAFTQTLSYPHVAPVVRRSFYIHPIKYTWCYGISQYPHKMRRVQVDHRWSTGFKGKSM